MCREPVEAGRAAAGASAELYGVSELADERDAAGAGDGGGVGGEERCAGGGE